MLCRAYTDALARRALCVPLAQRQMLPLVHMTHTPAHLATGARLSPSAWARLPRTFSTSYPRFSEVEPKKDTKNLTLKERASKMWSTIKYLFRFYVNGVKQIWRNRERVHQIRADVRETNRDFTWEEMQMIRTHSSDMVKLPLFLLILVTVEELLPLMVIYTPFLLPSTCILPSQKAKIQKQFEVKRRSALFKLHDLIPSMDGFTPAEPSVQAAVATLPGPVVQELISYVFLH